MYTFQDFQEELVKGEKRVIDFVRSAINQHKATNDYKIADTAYKYFCHRNTTINNFQKLLYKATGEVIPDNISANYKMASDFFHRFIIQENQFLLGNGTTWQNEETKDRLGNKRYPFDQQLQKAGEASLWGKVSFGFWNLNHLEVFNFLEFAPLYDEEDGAMKAGIRFWQVANDKPLRATLYELDGYTEYIWRKGEEGQVLFPKRTYKLKTRTNVADGTEIYAGENYDGFPIVPLWANQKKQSEFVGLQEQIDCYDLVKSGFADNIDEASFIFWTIQNAGGMDEVDLAEFINRIKTIHAYSFQGYEEQAQSHQLEVPYEAREALLQRIEKDLYKDAMALDTENIASGAVTATQIKASYEPLNAKVDGYEYCIKDFITDILDLAGIDDEPTFTRSMIINTQEEIQTLIQSASWLTEDYVRTRILNIFGDGDLAEQMKNDIDSQDLNRFSNLTDNTDIQNDNTDI